MFSSWFWPQFALRISNKWLKPSNKHEFQEIQKELIVSLNLVHHKRSAAKPNSVTSGKISSRYHPSPTSITTNPPPPHPRDTTPSLPQETAESPHGNTTNAHMTVSTSTSTVLSPILIKAYNSEESTP